VIPTQDVFWRGNLIELKRLLAAIGVTANSFLTPFDELSALKSAAQASLNIVLSDANGSTVAERFEELHQTPWFTAAIPFGPTATEQFLRSVAKRLGIAEAKVDSVIAEEAQYYYAFVERLADLYNDQDFQRNVVIVGTAANAFAIAKFVAEDLNWIPFAVAITDILDAAQIERVKARYSELPVELQPRLLFETDTSRVRDRVLELVAAEPAPYGDPIGPTFLLGSTLDRPLAVELKAGFWSVSYPIVNRIVTDQGYVGYRGGLRLATEILSVLVSNR
ncbi:MAG TPA: nitrogenase component 1, partial [Polyangiaceae bacterium]|nr:nitrogenase component 1 [Polyangiaceae bacterium]